MITILARKWRWIILILVWTSFQTFIIITEQPFEGSKISLRDWGNSSTFVRGRMRQILSLCLPASKLSSESDHIKVMSSIVLVTPESAPVQTCPDTLMQWTSQPSSTHQGHLQGCHMLACAWLPYTFAMVRALFDQKNLPYR